eukprot:CAMPEP_0172832190 /NCGR_PEP_ID=MMETSP1075-20121228/23478_1 /TAXON_ID=2916 /ORGANISM="Ceratium fusus, Strain PA161109" /LENGTH=87 /DNA_ID=CAMNT_0013674749 /DNA_START=110 /DNA_END=369 /DNA_ORIENTATION=-
MCPKAPDLEETPYELCISWNLLVRSMDVFGLCLHLYPTLPPTERSQAVSSEKPAPLRPLHGESRSAWGDCATLLTQDTWGNGSAKSS